MKTQDIKKPAKVGKINLLNPVPSKPKLPFVQEIQITHGDQIIGSANWHAPEGEDGIVQLLDLHIEESDQRQNHGSILLREVYRQARILFKALGIRPRRIWVTVEQKRQVNARAFFSRHGYHHVATIKNLHKRQDTLIYSRAFD